MSIYRIFKESDTPEKSCQEHPIRDDIGIEWKSFFNGYILHAAVLWGIWPVRALTHLRQFSRFRDDVSTRGKRAFARCLRCRNGKVRFRWQSDGRSVVG